MNDSCQKFPNYWRDHFNKNCQSLFRIDHIRLFRLLEISFYITMYTFISLFVGSFINSWFPKVDDKKSTGKLLAEVIGQMISLAVLIFYTTKIVNIIPWPLGYTGEYCPNDQNQLKLSYGIAQSLILVGSQTRLLNKVNLITLRMEFNS